MLPVGTRVMCVVDHAENNDYLHVGDLGIVCGGTDSLGRIKIRWDADVGGHTCDYTCENSHGWKVYPWQIQPLFEESEDLSFDMEGLLV